MSQTTAQRLLRRRMQEQVRGEFAPCGDCGMMCSATEYHPYAACLMFKGCGDAQVVRENLQSVLTRGGVEPRQETP